MVVYLFDEFNNYLLVFAFSCRSGLPDDLKRFIDKAHELGFYVFMDVVHSHTS